MTTAEKYVRETILKITESRPYKKNGRGIAKIDHFGWKMWKIMIFGNTIDLFYNGKFQKSFKYAEEIAEYLKDF